MDDFYIEMISVPFTIDEAGNAFAEATGVMRFDRGQVCVEYQVKDSIFGALKSAVKCARIDVVNIASADFKKSWFSGKITIKLKSVRGIEKFPTKTIGSLCFLISKSDRESAENFINALKTKISEEIIKKFDEK